MAIELSNITFTDQDDVVPASGVDGIVNSGIANTLAGNDILTGTASDVDTSVGIYNWDNSGFTTAFINTGEGNE
jgi:hypothetical protein